MKSYNECVTGILDKTEKKKAIQKKKETIILRSMSLCICCIILVFSVVVLPKIMDQSNDSLSSETNINMNEPDNKDSVFIPVMNLPENDLQLADMIGLVVYNGRIYTQAEYLKCDNETKQQLVGEYLGKASGTINEWSKKSAYDTELASNVTGDVYTVNGYDKSFRLCIPQMCEGSEFIAFFENLNGIELSAGENLYGDRLKLKDNYSDVVYQSDEDWNFGKENYKNYNDITDDEISDFINALYKAPFVDLSKAAPDIYSQNLKQAHIYFKMSNGTTVGIRLFENGYVGYDKMADRVFVKIEDVIFKKIFEASIK